MSKPFFCLCRRLKFIVVSIVFGLFATNLYGQTNTSVTQAQTIARLYSASLDRPPFTNGLNFFINSFASGRSVISIAEDFVLSAEFVAKYGELDDTGYVERLFLNVLGRPGAQGGIDFWVGNLTSGQSRAFVLSEFADSDENIAKTGVLYDSMAFIDGQWLYSLVDSVVKDSCGSPGCSQSELNGAVSGASIVITALRDADTVLETVTSLDENGLRAILGAGFFNDLSDLDRLQLLGTFPPIPVATGQLYLLTTTDGMDFDNDKNQQADVNPTAVLGQLHAIVSAEQLAKGMQVNVMTEAVYQSFFGTLPGLSDEEVVQGLDRAAAKLVKNINGDGAVDYLDVLAWRILFDNDNIRTDLNDVNKLAVAVSSGADTESLQILSNRMLGGAAAVGLDETSSVAISPDGTCDGRGRTIINRRQESISTAPPTAVCGDDDRGRVESTQGEVTGGITPGVDGLPTNTEIRGNQVDISGVDPASNTVTVEVTDNNGARRRGVVPVTSADAADELSRRYLSLTDTSVGPGNTSGMTIVRESFKSVGPTATEGELFAQTLTESMSYGALVSNFTACIVFRLVAQLEAVDEAVDPDVRSWALAGCTSALAEVNTWAAERTPTQIMTFETAVPEVDLDGCTDCFSLIASPQEGDTLFAGQSIAFNGVIPQTSTGVFWDFGDGESSESRAPSHTYAEPGSYRVEFFVDYRDGSFAVNVVNLNVVIDTSPDCVGEACNAFIPDTEAFYNFRTLRSQSEGTCLEANQIGPGSALGGFSFMTPCGNFTGQTWKFIDLTDFGLAGYYQFTSIAQQSLNLCLEGFFYDPDTQEGSAAFMGACSEEGILFSGTIWRPIPAENGYFFLQSLFREPQNECLESNAVAENAVLGGASYMTPCGSSNGQLWRFDKLP